MTSGGVTMTNYDGGRMSLEGALIDAEQYRPDKAMTRNQVRIGKTYIHILEERDWQVTVQGFDKDWPEEWYGTLAKPQGGLEVGTKCWGKVSELRAL